MIFHPRKEKFSELDEASRDVMHKTIAFFEDRGKENLKEEYHKQEWYGDFITFLKENRVFATLLTPDEHSLTGDQKRWDTHRICLMSEILGFYGLPYWYVWQVTILGLGPIWMSPNSSARKKAAALLEQGEIFAFGLSEKEHGADLYASEMSVRSDGAKGYLGNGRKYYIGNGNKAAMVSTFAMNEHKEYVWFAVDSQHSNYDCIKNIVPWQSHVSEYELSDYPLSEDDILSKGSSAWDSALNTVNIGKFNLGWASIGICTHAFYEAITHASHRSLYGKFVTDFPHVQQLFVDGFMRLLAMRLFAGRARDYLRCASSEDRRYMLYNPLVKMKVTTQGEEVIDLFWDVIAAKGFEKDMYFEMAAKEIRALPKLEGTVHVNMALVVKFMKNYLFAPKEYPEIPRRMDAVNDDFLFNQGPTRGLGKIQFHDYRLAYDGFHSPNIEIFKGQIELLKKLLVQAAPDEKQLKDIDFLLILGELFTLVVYGQLVIEEASFEQLSEEILEQIFDFMVRDFSRFSLKLFSKASSTPSQMGICREMMQKPFVDLERFGKVWKNTVHSNADAYEMNP